MKRNILVLLLSVSAALPIAAQPADKYLDDYKSWIRTIGSDDFGGRKPMTPFEDKTVEYLADEFAGLGLQPAFNGSWFQDIDMISVTVHPEKDIISVKAAKGRLSLANQDDFIIWTARATDKVELKGAEFVFCGFGIDAPEYGWNDYDGIDVKGKIVIAMVNDPGFYDATLFRGRNMTYYGRWTYKFEEALRKGAAGCLVLHNEAAASYGWHVCVNGHIENNLWLYDKASGNMDELAVKGWFNENACRRLFEKCGLDFEGTIADAKRPGFKSLTLNAKADIKLNVEYETGVTKNVAAVLPGTDRKDECVVFSAHWDHFGIGKPDETGDTIYNGAADNGSGLAAILMIAEKMRELPAPRRSVLFLAPTSEESGLFGSQYYCEHPAFPMDKTMACINFDCVAPAPLTKDISVLKEGDTILDPLLQAAAAAQNREIVFDNDNSDGWYYRSDHFNFVKKGVPAVVVKYGEELMDPARPNKYPQADWYHKPNDEYLEDWDFEGTVANVNLMYSVGLVLANE